MYIIVTITIIYHLPNEPSIKLLKQPQYITAYHTIVLFPTGKEQKKIILVSLFHIDQAVILQHQTYLYPSKLQDCK